MDPKYTKIVRVMPTSQWVVVEITGPTPQDMTTKVVETWKVSQKIIANYQNGVH